MPVVSLYLAMLKGGCSWWTSKVFNIVSTLGTYQFLNWFLAIWAEQHALYCFCQSQPGRNGMCQSQRVAKVLLSNLYTFRLCISAEKVPYAHMCTRVRSVAEQNKKAARHTWPERILR